MGWPARRRFRRKGYVKIIFTEALQHGHSKKNWLTSLGGDSFSLKRLSLRQSSICSRGVREKGDAVFLH